MAHFLTAIDTKSNSRKGDKWPSGGYVDPCAKTAPAQPESYFEFDTKTCEVIPKPGQPARRPGKTIAMINDLGLNNYHHLKKRTQWLTAVVVAIKAESTDNAARDLFIRRCLKRL